MSHHLSTETFQMDLRSSPSQQNLNPSRSSSLESNNRCDEMEQQSNEINNKSHKLDLYSIPVFLLEVLILIGLAYLAQFIHFQYQHDSMPAGFYCDDTSYRQQRIEDKFIQIFSHKREELTFVAGILVIPVVLIIFTELVNSMFGSVKFRQIRALCTCCKLHSITRRSMRFVGAFMLGLFIVMISCDILAATSGRLRPYFAQECPSAYQTCPVTNSNSQQPRDISSSSSNGEATINVPNSNNAFSISNINPPTKPISSTNNNNQQNQFGNDSRKSDAQLFSSSNSNSPQRTRRAAATTNTVILLERQWVDLSGQYLKDVCQFVPPTPLSSSGGLESSSGETSDIISPVEDANYRFNQLAMSWPSFPAAVFTYACLYISCYLCFVGTARPFRMITSVLVVVLLILATIFDVQLVKGHFNHWDDVVAGAFLAFIVTIFVLMVYLNKFKDTHYYENQKLAKYRAFYYNNQDSRKCYSGEQTGVIGQYSFDKTSGMVSNNNNNLNSNNNNALQNIETAGSVSNNDLAMRYFQIPRANYRGRQNFRV